MAEQSKPFVFDLDAVENERKDEQKFIAKVNGRQITFINPKDANWLDLADLSDDPAEFVALCVEDDADSAFLMSEDIPAWRMDKLIEAFMRHYGMNVRRGNRNASRR